MKKWTYRMLPLIAFAMPAAAQELNPAAPQVSPPPVAAPASVVAQPSPLEMDIAALQGEWAVVKYQTPGEDDQIKAITRLASKAAEVAKRYPERAEPLIWQGIILATKAGMDGPFSALSDAREARDLLEKAEKTDPSVLQGSVYTSLGSLYYKVPGFPIGFGDNDKAKSYLEKALAMNPNGIDPNFFYGEFMAEQGEYARAEALLNHALQAPPRPGRQLADRGRKEEIHNLLSDIAKKKGS